MLLISPSVEDTSYHSYTCKNRSLLNSVFVYSFGTSNGVQQSLS